MFFMPPDYYQSIAHLSMCQQLLAVAQFVVGFYISMIIFVVLNALLTASICWAMLLTCRLLGIPWVDGTTEGFINRK